MSSKNVSIPSQLKTSENEHAHDLGRRPAGYLFSRLVETGDPSVQADGHHAVGHAPDDAFVQRLKFLEVDTLLFEFLLGKLQPVGESADKEADRVERHDSQEYVVDKLAYAVCPGRQGEYRAIVLHPYQHAVGYTGQRGKDNAAHPWQDKPGCDNGEEVGEREGAVKPARAVDDRCRQQHVPEDLDVGKDRHVFYAVVDKGVDYGKEIGGGDYEVDRRGKLAVLVELQDGQGPQEEGDDRHPQDHQQPDLVPDLLGFHPALCRVPSSDDAC